MLKSCAEGAADLFEKIRTSFSPEVPKDNVFIVPGNHDVNRDNVLPTLHKGLDLLSKENHEEVKKQLSMMIRDKDGTWREMMRRLTDYRQFLEDNGYSHLLQDRDRLTYGHIREINGSKIGIAGLNSAWSCYKDSQKAKLWLAEKRRGQARMSND